MLKLPGPVLLSTFFRLSCLLRDLWKEEFTEENDAKIQPNIFYSENFNYFGMERIGGTFSYLKTVYHKIIKSKLALPTDSLPTENQTIDQSDNESCK